jgi:hypothetical protein
VSTKSDKYVGRVVDQNGSTKQGHVVNAWQGSEGVVGLYIDVEGKYITSDSEHWTIHRGAVGDGLDFLNSLLNF